VRLFKQLARNQRRFNSSILLVALGILLLVLSTACSPGLLSPPRLATGEARVENTPEGTAEPIFLPAPTVTPGAVGGQTTELLEAGILNIWINETSAEHREALQTMANDFTERSNIEVALQFVNRDLLPELASTAVLSDTLPDIILHPLEYSVAWTESGILDPTAANTVIDEIGRATFDQGALDLVAVDGETSAIPSDGFQQLLLYRKDWFDEKRLDAPDTYDDMDRGAETLFDPDNLISGLVIPTESNLITTQRAFEHIASANGCQLIDETGEVVLLEKECRDALDFYYGIVNQYSPSGVQTDTSARNAFLDGRTAMIMTTPSILPDLAEANRLDLNTGIITELSGEGPDSKPVNFGNITYLGITPVADKEAAAAFAKYWFNEGYQAWLAVESERKVPMRLGTEERPGFYIDAWGTAPILEGESLGDIYGPEVVTQLRDGIGATERWGFSLGQGALMGKLYEKLTLSIVLQEMLSGYFDSAKTIFEAYSRVLGMIPDYDHPVVPTPEA
jgi:multiple sugar transport system substrate-binding protein